MLAVLEELLPKDRDGRIMRVSRKYKYKLAKNGLRF